MPCAHSHSLDYFLQAAAGAVKRINLDIRIAMNAKKAGADLKELFEVSLCLRAHTLVFSNMRVCMCVCVCAFFWGGGGRFEGAVRGSHKLYRSDLQSEEVWAREGRG